MQNSIQTQLSVSVSSRPSAQRAGAGGSTLPLGRTSWRGPDLMEGALAAPSRFRRA